MWTTSLRRVVSAWLCLILLSPAALAQDDTDGAAGTPGRFDFYVLALSWSPTFCEGRGRSGGGSECGGRPYAFVVHGLWPQYERGFPRSCQIPPPRLPRRIVDSMLDLMPATRLIYHEWDEHGTCSGLSPEAYFETIRKARAGVTIPPAFSNVTAELQVAPEDVHTAFVKANPGLSADGMTITCDNRLREVRICLSKDLKFRSCEAIARRTCSRRTIRMPPVRGASR